MFPIRMTIDPDTLKEMAASLPPEERDEMAIPSLLHRNPLLRAVAWSRIHAVADQLDQLPRGGTLLDYGCGTGLLFEAALRRAERVVGVDIAPGPARLWAQRRGLTAVQVMEPAAARAALAPGSVAAVLCAEVLEHIDDPAELLGWFARVLRPGAALLVSLPTENRAYRFGRRLAGFHGHYHQHNAATLDALIQREGWARGHARHIPGPGPLSIYLIARYSRPA